MGTYINFQTAQGPGDRNLRRNEIEGYQPVSRIGETVLNAFIDSYYFERITTPSEAHEATDKNGYVTNLPAEYRPMFHEWATALPGMICLSRKDRTNYSLATAAETAVPVVCCAAALPLKEENNFFFAGICRSKSVRAPDDGIGPSADEFFTLSIGGMATIINNSGTSIQPGELLEWCFESKEMNQNNKRSRADGPRRFGVRVASPYSARIIGKSLNFARRGDAFDILLKQ